MITQKFAEGVGSGREGVNLGAFEEVLIRKQDPARMRVVEYSVQRDHYHMIVEVPGGRGGLGGALRCFHSSLGKAWNRVQGRRGTVLGSYDEVVLGNARLAGNAVAYVLWNGWHHDACGLGIDRASSGRWSRAWHSPCPWDEVRLPPVFAPTTGVLLEAFRRFPLHPMAPPTTLIRQRDRRRSRRCA